MSENKINQMKEDYETMKIPPALKGMVMESIKKAKKEEEEEMRKNRNNNKIYTIAKRTVQIAAGLLVAITVAANSNAAIANAMEKIPVIGAITKVVTFRNYEVKNENTEANIKVPQIEVVSEEGGSAAVKEAAEKINKSVEEYTNELIAQFEKDAEEFAALQGEDGGPHEAVFTDYDVVMDNDTLFSLRINTTVSQGGSINLTKIYHIDKRTDQVITLKDLFTENSDYIKILSDTVKDIMRQNMAADENLSYFIDSEDGMEEFDFKEIKPEQNFYLTESQKLTLVFDEYEVAPGYMGVVAIEIPTESIADILKEGFVK